MKIILFTKLIPKKKRIIPIWFMFLRMYRLNNEVGIKEKWATRVVDFHFMEDILRILRAKSQNPPRPLIFLQNLDRSNFSFKYKKSQTMKYGVEPPPPPI